MEKVILSLVKFNNNWFSIKDNNGREINIPTVDKKTQAPVNQKLKAILEKAVGGEEVEMDVREWQGKFYGNEAKSGGNGGGKSFPAKDKSFEAANSAATAAAAMLSLKKESTTADFDTMFEHIHAKIMSKISK